MTLKLGDRTVSQDDLAAHVSHCIEALILEGMDEEDLTERLQQDVQWGVDERDARDGAL